MCEVIIYTDGGCRGNPGPGGWGATLQMNAHKKELYGYVVETTNNRMELTAAVKALETLQRSCMVSLHTDSQYLRQGITTWITNWKRNGWKTAQKKPVKNADLWQQLDQAAARHQVDWCWVKGHAGDPGNERADQLVNLAIDRGLAGEIAPEVVVTPS